MPPDDPSGTECPSRDCCSHQGKDQSRRERAVPARTLTLGRMSMALIACARWPVRFPTALSTRWSTRPRARSVLALSVHRRHGDGGRRMAGFGSVWVLVTVVAVGLFVGVAVRFGPARPLPAQSGRLDGT
jgi:hypothetical protein